MTARLPARSPAFFGEPAFGKAPSAHFYAPFPAFLRTCRFEHTLYFPPAEPAPQKKDNDMSNYSKGRADRAAEKNDPPPRGSIFVSDRTNEKRNQARDQYREGHADKDRQIKKK